VEQDFVYFLVLDRTAAEAPAFAHAACCRTWTTDSGRTSHDPDTMNEHGAICRLTT